MVLAKRAKFFDEEIYPEPEAELVGYAWLINEFQLRVPAPNSICAIVPAKNAKRSKDRWLIWGSRYQPEAHWFAELIFALKYEGVDLAIMKSLFGALAIEDISMLLLKMK